MTHAETSSSFVDTRVIDCGENLEQLKKLPDKCIDVVYIDPPCDSGATFKEFWKELKEKVAFHDCPESTQTYMDFMRPRCVELARILKPTGTFYYHCDWDAEHYIKVMLDQILGESNFVNEVHWKRQERLGRAHGVLLRYAGDLDRYFEHLYHLDDWDSAEKLYVNVEAGTGRRYRHGDLVAVAKAASSNETLKYEFLGVTRSWRYSKEAMQKLYAEGRIDQTTLRVDPYFKLYLDEVAGFPVGSAWDDIKPLHAHDEERLEYPSKEPLKLLERICEIAVEANDADPGEDGRLGTALVASLTSARQWIGIGHFSNALPRQDEMAPVGDSAAAA